MNINRQSCSKNVGQQQYLPQLQQQHAPQHQALLLSALTVQQRQQHQGSNYLGTIRTVTTRNNVNQHTGNAQVFQTRQYATASVHQRLNLVSNQRNGSTHQGIITGQTAANASVHRFGNNQPTGSRNAYNMYPGNNRYFTGEQPSAHSNRITDSTPTLPSRPDTQRQVQSGSHFETELIRLTIQGPCIRSLSMDDAHVLQHRNQHQALSTISSSNVRNEHANVTFAQAPSCIVQHGKSTESAAVLPTCTTFVNTPNSNSMQSQRSSQPTTRMDEIYQNQPRLSANHLATQSYNGHAQKGMPQMEQQIQTPISNANIDKTHKTSVAQFQLDIPVQNTDVAQCNFNFSPLHLRMIHVKMADGSMFPVTLSFGLFEALLQEINASIQPQIARRQSSGVATSSGSNISMNTPINRQSTTVGATTTSSSISADIPLSAGMPFSSFAHNTTDEQNFTFTQQSLVTTAGLSTNFNGTVSSCIASSGNQIPVPHNSNILQRSADAVTTTVNCTLQTSVSENQDSSTNFKIPSVTRSDPTPTVSTTSGASTNEPAISKEVWEYIYSPQVSNHIIDDEPQSESLPFWICDPEQWQKENENRSRIMSGNGQSQPSDPDQWPKKNEDMSKITSESSQNQPSVTALKNPAHMSHITGSLMKNNTNNDIDVTSTGSQNMTKAPEIEVGKQTNDEVIVIDDDSIDTEEHFINAKLSLSEKSSNKQLAETDPDNVEINDVTVPKERCEQQSPNSADNVQISTNNTLSQHVTHNETDLADQGNHQRPVVLQDPGHQKRANITPLRLNALPTIQQKCRELAHLRQIYSEVSDLQERFQCEVGKHKSTVAPVSSSLLSSYLTTENHQQILQDNNMPPERTGKAYDTSATSPSLLDIIDPVNKRNEIQPELKDFVAHSQRTQSKFEETPQPAIDMNDKSNPTTPNEGTVSLSNKVDNFSVGNEVTMKVSSEVEQKTSDEEENSNFKNSHMLTSLPHCVRRDMPKAQFAPGHDTSEDSATLSQISTPELHMVNSLETEGHHIEKMSDILGLTENHKRHNQSVQSNPLSDAPCQHAPQETSSKISFPDLCGRMYVSSSVNAANPLVIKLTKSKRKTKQTSCEPNHEVLRRLRNPFDMLAQKPVVEVGDDPSSHRKHHQLDTAVALTLNSPDRSESHPFQKEKAQMMRRGNRQTDERIPQNMSSQHVKSAETLFNSTAKENIRSRSCPDIPGNVTTASLQPGHSNERKAVETMKSALDNELSFRNIDGNEALHFENSCSAATDQISSKITVSKMHSEECIQVDKTMSDIPDKNFIPNLGLVQAAECPKVRSPESTGVASGNVCRVAHPTASTSDYSTLSTSPHDSTSMLDHTIQKSTESPNYGSVKLIEWLNSQRSDPIASQPITDLSVVDKCHSITEQCTPTVHKNKEMGHRSSTDELPEKFLRPGTNKTDLPKTDGIVRETTMSSEPHGKISGIRPAVANVEKKNHVDHVDVNPRFAVSKIMDDQLTQVPSQPSSAKENINGSPQAVLETLVQSEESMTSLDKLKPYDEFNNIVSQSAQCLKDQDLSIDANVSSSAEKEHTDNHEDSRQKVSSSNALKSCTSLSESEISETDSKKLKIKPNLSQLHAFGKKVGKPKLICVKIPLSKQNIFSRFNQMSSSKSNCHDGSRTANSVTKPDMKSERQLSAADKDHKLISGKHQQNKAEQLESSAETSTSETHQLQSKMQDRCETNTTGVLNRKNITKSSENQSSKKEVVPGTISNELPHVSGDDVYQNETEIVQTSDKMQTILSDTVYSDISDEEMDFDGTETCLTQENDDTPAANPTNKFSDISDEDSVTGIDTSDTPTVKPIEKYSDLLNVDGSISGIETLIPRKTNETLHAKYVDSFSDISDEDENIAKSNHTSVPKTDKTCAIDPTDKFVDGSPESNIAETECTDALNISETTKPVRRFSDVSNEAEDNAETRPIFPEKTVQPRNSFAGVSIMQGNAESECIHSRTEGEVHTVGSMLASCEDIAQLKKGSLLSSVKRHETSSVLSVFCPTKDDNGEGMKSDQVKSDQPLAHHDSDNGDDLVIDTDDERGGGNSLLSNQTSSDIEKTPGRKRISSEEGWPFLSPTRHHFGAHSLRSPPVTETSLSSFVSAHSLSGDNLGQLSAFQNSVESTMGEHFNDSQHSAVASNCKIHDGVGSNPTASEKKSLPINEEDVEDNERNIFKTFASFCGQQLLSNPQTSPMQPVTDKHENAIDSSNEDISLIVNGTTQVSKENAKSAGFEGTEKLLTSTNDNSEITESELNSASPSTELFEKPAKSTPHLEVTKKPLPGQVDDRSIPQDIKPDMSALSQGTSAATKSTGTSDLNIIIKKENELLASINVKKEFKPSSSVKDINSAEPAIDSSISNDENTDELTTMTDSRFEVEAASKSPLSTAEDIASESNTNIDRTEESAEMSRTNSKLKSLFNLLMSGVESPAPAVSRHYKRSSPENSPTSTDRVLNDNGNELTHSSQSTIRQTNDSTEEAPSRGVKSLQSISTTDEELPSSLIGDAKSRARKSCLVDTITHKTNTNVPSCSRPNEETVKESLVISTQSSDTKSLQNPFDADDALLASSDSDPETQTASANHSLLEANEEFGLAGGRNMDAVEKSSKKLAHREKAKSLLTLFDDDDLLASSDSDPGSHIASANRTAAMQKVAPSSNENVSGSHTTTEKSTSAQSDTGNAEDSVEISMPTRRMKSSFNLLVADVETPTIQHKKVVDREVSSDVESTHKQNSTTGSDPGKSMKKTFEIESSEFCQSKNSKVTMRKVFPLQRTLPDLSSDDTDEERETETSTESSNALKLSSKTESLSNKLIADQKLPIHEQHQSDNGIEPNATQENSDGISTLNGSSNHPISSNMSHSSPGSPVKFRRQRKSRPVSSSSSEDDAPVPLTNPSPTKSRSTSDNLKKRTRDLSRSPVKKKLKRSRPVINPDEEEDIDIEKKRSSTPNRVKQREYVSDDSEASDGEQELPTKHNNPFILTRCSSEEDIDDYDDIVITGNDDTVTSPGSGTSSKSSVLDLTNPDVYEADSQSGASSDGNNSDPERLNESHDIPEMSIRAPGSSALDSFTFSVVRRIKQLDGKNNVDSKVNRPSPSDTRTKSEKKSQKKQMTASNMTPASKRSSARNSPITTGFTKVNKTPVDMISDFVAKKYVGVEADEVVMSSESEGEIEPLKKRQRFGNDPMRKPFERLDTSRHKNDSFGTSHRKKSKVRRRIFDKQRTSRDLLPLRPILLRGSIRTASGRHSWFTRDKCTLKPCLVKLVRLEKADSDREDYYL